MSKLTSKLSIFKENQKETWRPSPIQNPRNIPILTKWNFSWSFMAFVVLSCARSNRICGINRIRIGEDFACTRYGFAFSHEFSDDASKYTIQTLSISSHRKKMHLRSFSIAQFYGDVKNTIFIIAASILNDLVRGHVKDPVIYWVTYGWSLINLVLVLR